MNFTVISVFPEMFSSVLGSSTLKRAREKHLLSVRFVNPRDYAEDRHRTTDDSPYGGGQGMVMKPGPLISAIKDVRRERPMGRVLLLSPRGRVFDQRYAAELAASADVALVCGRYEGIDERVARYVDDLLSIGDYTTSGGEIPAMAVIETVTRLIPGVLGNERSAAEDSFAQGLLEYPQYTRPVDYEGERVPDVLLSGNHAEIQQWRRTMSIELTRRYRPDLLVDLEPEDEPRPHTAVRASVYTALVHYPVNDKNGQVVTSSITNLDIHDIARCCRTYGIRSYYIVNPVQALQKLAAKIIDHWQMGYGSAYNDTRKDALALVRLSDTLEEAIVHIERECGTRPMIVATSARQQREAAPIITFANLRGMVQKKTSPVVILFGTGWGLADSVLASADYVLEPIVGRSDYNHLSVRGAAAIILDRVLAR